MFGPTNLCLSFLTQPIVTPQLKYTLLHSSTSTYFYEFSYPDEESHTGRTVRQLIQRTTEYLSLEYRQNNTQLFFITLDR